MLGAIFGDIVGSVYERHNVKTTDFPLLSYYSHPTDDSIMTLAIAKALMETYEIWSGENGESEESKRAVSQAVSACMQLLWGTGIRTPATAVLSGSGLEQKTPGPMAAGGTGAQCAFLR